VTFPKLCAVVPQRGTGYFKILFFLPIYVYYSFKWLIRCQDKIDVKLFGPNYLRQRMLGISFGLGGGHKKFAEALGEP